MKSKVVEQKFIPAPWGKKMDMKTKKIYGKQSLIKSG